MNLQHLRTFVWLRWRLLINQLRRGGLANAILLALVAGVVFLVAVAALVGSFLMGRYALGQEPAVLMFVWDGLVLGCLFFWATGTLAELQRAEALSLDKFLHLPVSLRSAFFINYVSLFFSPTLVIFLLAMLGLSAGLVAAHGTALVAQFPLMIAFVLALTAVTYQFQGWLASLMVNKRRRRTVIVLVTAAFMLVAQAPNLINVVRPWDDGTSDVLARLTKDQDDLRHEFEQRKITLDEFQKRQNELVHGFEKRLRDHGRQKLRQAEEIGRVLNLILPPGWLPLGVMEAARGHFLPAILGTLGLSLIAAASLVRSYRTTLRLYTGYFTKGKGRPAAPPPVPVAPVARSSMVQWRLPWLSEEAQAIALAGCRSLSRAPEVKMLLLGPLLILLILGSSFLLRARTMPPLTRPLLPFGAALMVLFSIAQLIGNQFAFDRSGFRAFVLSPAPRREVLVGKNLAFVPVAAGLAAVFLVVLVVMAPLRLDHLLAVLPRWVSMYLIFCMAANLLSITAPLPIAAGSLRPANPRVLPLLLQAATFFLMPLLLAPTLLPLALEVALTPWLPGVPVDLIGSLALCVVVVFVYRAVATWEGTLLQRREQRILELVTTRAE